ncbi:GMC family oxidoreductase [Pseudomonas sp. N040]|uniref:GMC family oxidoreductase n=1 Tax=Pseudomonas sp. N040 TaxID=2785325 RepID=UPI0018A2AF74|nr:choline dehydrogenase [Pseudomonas sp. N040]MBF7729399.1 choline dehydrogenase [Pseudomonas sp. N040]MBW7013039.1 choline dehydrogenase [Pseudomonas sp. N040]
MQEFDYVIVGGGSAGSVLAGRLSEDSAIRVCLLEAGGRGDSQVVKVPMGMVAMMPTTLNNWAFDTLPQPGLNGRIGYQPRGRMLGGSSGSNAMVYIRGHRWDYDHWAAQGNPGWSYADLLPYFKRSEHNETLHDEWHGQGGPLNVAELRSDNPFQGYYLDAARQAGFPLIRDFNGAEQEGVGIYQVTQKGGERWSSARAYLHPHMQRPNLTVITGARGRRVLFEGTRATAVEYSCGGRVEQVAARREVLLCAGAFQSPQLLMLSGVGDSEQLREVGIEPLHHLPGVGQNLQDHPDFVFVYKARDYGLFGLSLGGSLRMLKEFWRYITGRRGMLTSNVAEGGAFLKTDPSLPAPDVQLHFATALVVNHARTLIPGHGYSCHVCLLRPKSRGSVKLRSADPEDAPLIDPNFFGEPEDLEVLVKGFKLTRQIMDAPALASRRHTELFTAQVHSDEQIRQVLRERSDSVYHPIGTCKMGSDPLAVVDAELRVHGLQGLRVVDASIMPSLIGGNTNAPTIMLAEKAVDLIRARRIA